MTTIWWWLLQNTVMIGILMLSHAVMPMHAKATRLAARPLACSAFQVPDAAPSILALVREEHCGIDSSDGVALPAGGFLRARRTRYQ